MFSDQKNKYFVDEQGESGFIFVLIYYKNGIRYAGFHGSCSVL